MTKIIMLLANLMVAIAAITPMPIKQGTVTLVGNVPSWMKLLVCTIGLVMAFVMMSTTKPNVSLILVIVATITILTNTRTVTLVTNVRS